MCFRSEIKGFRPKDTSSDIVYVEQLKLENLSTYFNLAINTEIS
jgi:hypothetical protein